MARSGRPVNLRLDETLVGKVEAIAHVEETTLTSLASEALEALVVQRVGSVEFQRKRDEAKRKHDELLNSLG